MLTAIAFLAASSALARPEFDEHFTGRTLRFDYHHAGTAGEEHVAPDAWRLEGEWPGSRTLLLDESNLGKYLVVLIDPRTNRALYSRGFASVYGEWETTGEARTQWRSLHESVRLPEPRFPAQLVLKKRAADGTFRELYSTTVDPAGRFVDRSAVAPLGRIVEVAVNGPPAARVDLLYLAEGYTAEEHAKFRGDVERLNQALFATEPFARRAGDFNVRAIHPPAAEAGISNPRRGEWRDTPLGASFNAFDSDRYVLTTANRELREVAAQVPYDALVLVLNVRKYGGGGIYELYSTCAADSSEAEYLLVHEFGHSFAGLGDEYYTSQVAYEEFNQAGVEPWEPNITALTDPARLKWRDLVAENTPLPTPWEQGTFDEISLAYEKRRNELVAGGASDEEFEALFGEVRAATKPLLEAQTHFGATGAFEGASYEAKGLYRPAVDCIMFTRNPKSFCAVCDRAVERAIDRLVR
jgi:hypothetical protein